MSWLGSVIFQVIPRFIWGPVRSSWVCVLECKTLKLKERTLSFYHCHCPNTYESFCARPGLLSGLNGYKTIKDRNCKPFFYGHFLCTLTFSYLFNNKCNCVCFVLGCFLCQKRLKCFHWQLHKSTVATQERKLGPTGIWPHSLHINNFIPIYPCKGLHQEEISVY